MDLPTSELLFQQQRQRETQYRKLVADSMPVIPSDVNFIDGFNLISDLYNLHDHNNIFSLISSMEPVVIGKFRLLVLEKLRPLLALPKEIVPDVKLEMKYRRAITASMGYISRTI